MESYFVFSPLLTSGVPLQSRPCHSYQQVGVNIVSPLPPSLILLSPTVLPVLLLGCISLPSEVVSICIHPPDRFPPHHPWLSITRLIHQTPRSSTQLPIASFIQLIFLVTIHLIHPPGLPSPPSSALPPVSSLVHLASRPTPRPAAIQPC